MLDRKSIEIIHLQSLKNQENHNGEDERKQCAKETSSQFQRKITELELKKKIRHEYYPNSHFVMIGNYQ